MPREQGIFEELAPVENDLTVEDIASRVEKNRGLFEAKFNKKKSSQDAYYANK